MGKIKSDHNKFELRSLEMKQFMDNALEELKAFHDYAIENDIEYSIRSGSAIGYLTTKNYLPWDDDIDISYNNKCYDNILNLFNSGVLSENIWKDNNWEFRSINLNNQSYYMAKLVGAHYNRFKPHSFFKLLKNNNQIFKNQNDLGGLDIFPQRTFADKIDHELKFNSKPIKIKFAGIDTMLLYDEQHINEMIRIYGHPSTWGTYLNEFNLSEIKIRTENLNKLFNDFKINK
jgi:hypothetical protein